MSARHKLNQSKFIGIAIVAGAVGAIFNSWPVFWIAVCGLAAGALHGGDIRLGGRRSQRM